MSYAIRLEYPPTVNTYYRRAGNVMYLSPAGRKFKKQVASDCRVMCMADALTGRIGVQIELAAPNRTRDTDIDNRVKAVLDALEGIAFENDRQIDQLIVKRLPIDEGGDGYADVIVSELKPSLLEPHKVKDEHDYLREIAALREQRDALLRAARKTSEALNLFCTCPVYIGNGRHAQTVHEELDAAISRCAPEAGKEPGNG